MENKEIIEKLAAWLRERHFTSIKKMMEEGANEYYAMCRYLSNDYITRSQIREGIESSEYDEFEQQSPVLDKLEQFAEISGIDYLKVSAALESIKREIQDYLLGEVEDIARAANEELED